MKPLNANTKRALKAREIHQNTYIGTVIVGMLIGIVCLLLFLSLMRWLGWDGDDVGGSIGILGVIFIMPTMTMAQNRARRALRQSGLLREETEAIQRVGAIASGEPLEVRESSLWGRLSVIAFFAALMLVCAWLIGTRPVSLFYLWGGGLSIVTFGALVLLMLFNIGRPELLVNDEGISSCQSGMGNSVTSWDSVAVMERQRVWGLPPDYSFEGAPNETITLKDAANKPVLILHSGVVGALILPDRQRFIAEIERRLRGDPPLDAPGNLLA